MDDTQNDQQTVVHESTVAGMVSVWRTANGKRLYSIKVPAVIDKDRTLSEIMEDCVEVTLSMEKKLKESAE